MNGQGQYKIDKKQMDEIMKKQKIHQKKTEKKKVSAGTMIFRAVCAVIAIAYFALIIFGRFFMDEKGVFLSSINPFSNAENPNTWLRFVGLAIITLSVSFVLRFILGKLVNVKSVTKKIGIAFIELIANLVKYVSYIVIIFLVLSAFGINTGEILAGLGILALIIGLGVTSLIEDIVAGIFIIAERLFDVGDIIVLDGFRGTVVSIGIRSTKIADVGNDVLTVRNSSIGSLVNLTDRLSCVAITVPIAPHEVIEHVDEVVKNAHIEMIAKTSPKFQSEPIYLGLYDITKKGVQLVMFIAPCKEEDRYDVERMLFHAVKVIFDNNNIQLGAPSNISDDE